GSRSSAPEAGPSAPRRRAGNWQASAFPERRHFILPALRAGRKVSARANALLEELEQVAALELVSRHAGGDRRFHVGIPIADDEGAGRVGGPFALQLQDHAGLRLAVFGFRA